jgi:aspartyl-tRNA synthetase
VTKILRRQTARITQIDCEMAFVEQEDILNVFEGLTRHLLKERYRSRKVPKNYLRLCYENLRK